MASSEATASTPKPTTAPKVGGILYARNNVPYYQRYYQRAYANHVRIWQIHPRSKWYMRTYLTLFYSTAAATVYMLGRKVAGHNTWFSSD